MDLYIQVGVLLVMAAMFSVIVYYYGDSMDRGLDIQERLSEPSENYSADSSISSPTFFVDHRVFSQWATNARSQRKVYIMYPPNLTPVDTIYGQYKYALTVEMNDQDQALRKVIVESEKSPNPKNAYLVNDQNPKTLDFLNLFAQEAKAVGTNKMVTIHTFTQKDTGELMYLCYIK